MILLEYINFDNLLLKILLLFKQYLLKFFKQDPQSSTPRSSTGLTKFLGSPKMQGFAMCLGGSELQIQPRRGKSTTTRFGTVPPFVRRCYK